YVKIIAGLKNFLIKKKVKTVKKTKDETTKVEEKTDTLFDLKVQDENLKKKRILKRIKNEQEKQKRKFDKLKI
ncbi:MAG: hypothetical protein QHH15_06650, partial [Candidatus Thermoplasmatota archaeon]|nr:hypothetical protein [Candidatus Thermoplasmatota archaeon]